MTEPCPDETKYVLRDELDIELHKRAMHYDAAMMTLATEMNAAIDRVRQEHSRLLFAQAIGIAVCIVLLFALFLVVGRGIYDLVEAVEHMS